MGEYSLVLEYADGGNLAKMFEKTPPPKTFSDVLQFWRSMADVLNGLHRIHTLMKVDDRYLKGYVKMNKQLYTGRVH
jgi:serine/threonine protein kinase